MFHGWRCSWSLALLLGGVELSCPRGVAAHEPATIEVRGKIPESLVGDGRHVVRVRADGYDFHHGGDGHGRFRLRIGGELHELSFTEGSATFFPGGVIDRLRIDGVGVEILHGAFAGVPYLAAFRLHAATGPVALVVDAQGSPSLTPAGELPFDLVDGTGELVLAAGVAPPAGRFDELRSRIEAPYREGLVLATPDPDLDRAVAFSRALLDLGFDGHLHVCELFRWRDVWSRDLGSGLVPGAMASGRFDAARTTIDYDLARYAKADPRGLKVTEDPSQGGTAEGTAWLARAVWQHYLLTGDRATLANDAAVLRPWVEAWLARDADGRGLLVDVSEWMDHSRFFLFPDGARVLYSNVLFADLLRTFSHFERELGDEAAAARYARLGERFAHAINAELWDEGRGVYDNLELWGRRDERIPAAENALAVLTGVASPERAKRALAAVRASNWRAAGSTTIFPPMSHVPPSNDHNFKMWPWWNAVEARARFRSGDVAGAVHLLDRCAATLADEHYPGMMEELTSPTGATEGGNAFLTGAGSFLDAVVEGLLGVEIVNPGRTRLRVAPKTPEAWHDWHAEVPLPSGHLRIGNVAGQLTVRVDDAQVQVIEAPRGTEVVGARLVEMAVPGEAPAALTSTVAPPTPPHPFPPPKARSAAVLISPLTTESLATELPARRVTVDELARLDPATTGALLVPGNALPLLTSRGDSVADALASYLDRGGALVFWGATMHPRGTMGETGGVIEWYDRRPEVEPLALGGWKIRMPEDPPTTPAGEESGLRHGWQQRELADQSGDETDWREVAVPMAWEKALGRELDGWGWYRAHFRLPAEARGRVLVVDLGRVDDRDWTWVDGELVGAKASYRDVRRYRLRPGDAAYRALRFDDDNVVAVRVFDDGGAGGLSLDLPRVGLESSELAWQPIDAASGEVVERPSRHAVVSWGPGPFFASWEARRGAFGFAIDGQGVDFAGPLAALAPLDVAVHEAFTDFAVALPWRFEPLAFTHTERHLLEPDRGERYPCAARLVNLESGGEIFLVPFSLARSARAAEVFRALGFVAGDAAGSTPGRTPPAGALAR